MTALTSIINDIKSGNDEAVNELLHVANDNMEEAVQIWIEHEGADLSVGLMNALFEHELLKTI